MSFSLQPQRSRWRIVGLGVCLLLLGTGVGLQGLKSVASRPSSTRPALLTLDSRLVLHQHVVPFSGTIAGGLSVDGTLWPGLPGLNKISLRLLLPGRPVAPAGWVKLVLSMPGMAMRPVQASLTARSQSYRGNVALPMFGRYHAQVEVSTASGRYTGPITLILPLTFASLPTGASSARP